MVKKSPPTLINKLFSNFKMKANHLSGFFASHCTLLNNSSKVPESQQTVSFLHYFENANIIKIIRSLDTNKVHRHDDISIRMLKLCDLAIIKLLSSIFRNCINHSTFPDIWRKLNICPIHKSEKQIINNYCRIASLQSICGKIFERIIFNSLF